MYENEDQLAVANFTFRESESLFVPNVLRHSTLLAYSTLRYDENQENFFQQSPCMSPQAVRILDPETANKGSCRQRSPKLNSLHLGYA